LIVSLTSEETRRNYFYGKQSLLKHEIRLPLLFWNVLYRYICAGNLLVSMGFLLKDLWRWNTTTNTQLLQHQTSVQRMAKLY